MQRSRDFLWLRGTQGGIFQLQDNQRELVFMGAIDLTLSHHPYRWSFHMFACSNVSIGSRVASTSSVPLTVRSKRSFFNGAKSSIVVYEEKVG